jgi:pimeloyl-ACP methyl ester carboxylesterase
MRFPDTPLVLLHAFPLDHRMWDGVRTGLAEHVELITPDQRGFGGTPLGTEEPSLDTVAEDVIDRLDGRRALIGGCSMGSYVAMAIVRAAPELVAGLVLISGRATSDTEAARANRHAMASKIEDEGSSFVADVMIPALLGSETHERRPEIVESVRALVSEQDGAAIAWAQRAMAARPDSSELLRTTDVPTLVIRGEQDTLIPTEEADALAALMPKAEVVILAGAGHLPPLEVPEEFTGTIARWLE